MRDRDSTRQYEDYREWKAWSTADFGVLRNTEAAYYATELARAGLTDLTALKVFELGFGNGSFATWAVAQNAEYFGCEVINELVALGVKSGYTVKHADEPIDTWVPLESLDVVVAFDVFEHLPIAHLESLLKDFRACMKHGALLIARMPSGDSPFSRAIQYGDLTHCVSLGSSAIKQLAARTGFEVSSVRSPATALRGIGFSHAIRRLLVEFVRILSYFFITNFLMGGGRPVLSPNMVFVWRKPK